MNLREQLQFENLKMYMRGRLLTTRQKMDAKLEFDKLIKRYEWLEQRNKEHVEVLEGCKRFVEANIETGEVIPEHEGEAIAISNLKSRIEEQLKKAGIE